MKPGRLLNILTAIMAAASSACGTSSFDPPAPPTEEVEDVSEKLSRMTATESIADGMTPSIVTLYIMSNKQRGLSGRQFQLKVSGSGNVIMPCTLTDDQGVAKCKIYSTKAEVKRVTAWELIVLEGNVEFTTTGGKHNSAAIVPSGKYDIVSSKPRAVSSLGLIETPAQMRDGAGKVRVHSSLHGSILSH